MTKDEFIDRFITASGMPKACRTPDGVKDGRFEMVAVPCTCGGSYSDPCAGWQMVRPSPAERAKIKVIIHTPG